MNLHNFLRQGFYLIYRPLSLIWLRMDRRLTWNEMRFWTDHVPRSFFTTIHHYAYTVWIWNQGVFAGLIGVFLKQPNPKILDWGCGLGNLAPVCYHFVKDGGQYTGIDIDKTSIDACLDTYKDLRNCRFIRSTDSNDFYKQQDRLNKDNTSIVWPVENHSQDLVIAVSVFTHIQEPDAVRYMAKIHEVLVDGGIAMLTFLVARKFQNPQPVFTFSYPLASPGWFTSRPDCPEEAVAVTEEALAKLLGSRFKIIHRIEGQCSGGKGPSLQEILVLKACAT